MLTKFTVDPMGVSMRPPQPPPGAPPRGLKAANDQHPQPGQGTLVAHCTPATLTDPAISP
jgi:hypothetical protein